MKTKYLYLCMLFMPLFSCKKDNSASGASNVAAKGYVTGKVTDTKGNPIAGASVLLDNTITYASYVNGTSGPDGKYQIKLPTGNYSIWKASATIQKSYDNKTYTLDMAPDNTNSITDDGAVCDFSWKLSGQQPDGSTYYGGTIDMDAGTGSAISDWNGIVLTLTPVSVLIDGSPGRAMTITFGSANWPNYVSGIIDIPIGRYKATAIYRYHNADYQLYLQNRQTNDGFRAELVFDFEPQNRWGHRNAATLEFHE
ncbi:MAG TPA: carboxypeptidase-like regulatory domain-containing protein [Edaphocola sp.]|nr:carboxypeptidase-like regulatory domain-containing protein [Edaphocola sp.]